MFFLLKFFSLLLSVLVAMSVLENPLIIPPVQMDSNINLLLGRDVILDVQSGKYEVLLFDLDRKSVV